MKNLTPETLATMTVHEKLMEARIRFLEAGAKKSGINRHAEFTYFELSDIVPIASKVFDDLHLLFLTTYNTETAQGELINLDAPTDRLYVVFPMSHIAEPAKYRMNEVQALGAEITYTRRYLYMLLLDIVESDAFDGQDDTKPSEPAPEPAPKKEPVKKTPKSKEERKQIKEELTSEEKPSTDEEKKEIMELLTKLLDTSPEQEDFIRQVLEKTDTLQKMTNIQAQYIRDAVNQMLAEVENGPAVE